MGFLNKFIEIFALAVYFNALYRAIFELTTWSLRHDDYISIIHVLAKRGEQMDQNWGKITIESIGNSTLVTEAFDLKIPECFYDEHARLEVFGGSKEWIIFELIVAFSFIFTMVLLMMKSRFINIGIDNSYQFEPIYMSYMVNRIINHIEFGFKKSDGMTMQEYQTNVPTQIPSRVTVNSTKLRLCLSKEAYNEAR